MPDVQRDGDTWAFTWNEHNIGMGVERIREKSDSLKAEVTVESGVAGRVLGPNTVDLLSARSQTEFANACARRVNGLSEDTWRMLVVHACARVAHDYRQPTRTIRLADVQDSGPIKYVIPNFVPRAETTVIYGDGECLAAGSVVQGPAGSERVEVLAKRGLPVPVWTLGLAGKTWAWASAPWLKGHGTLLRFTLDGGRAITVANRHRFLTADGWRFASDLAVGERIAVSQPSPLPSIAARDPRVSLLSAQHCLQTPADCGGGCWPGCRRYGRQLRPRPAVSLIDAPSPTDALEHSLDSWPQDGRASSVRCSRGSSSDHLANYGCAAELQQPSGVECCGVSLRAIPRSANSQVVQPFPEETTALAPTGECPRCGIRSWLSPDRSSPRPLLPPGESLPYRSIVSITVAGEGDYYDLSVPGTENYLANGIWHHNSAKSLLALRLAFSVATGQMVPWGHDVEVGNVLYLDWETNDETVASYLRRISKAMCTPVPDNVYYRQCFRSLSDELPNIREEISRKHIMLVVVDSIGFAASGALVDDDTARTAMNALRLMSPATRLVVAHVSTATARDAGGTARPFGSAFFWNGMRSGIEIRRSEEASSDNVIDLGMYHRKSNKGRHARPLGVSVTFGEDDGILFEDAEITDVPDLAARAPLSMRVRELLRQGAMSTRDIATELEAKEESVYKTLRRMEGVVMLEGGRGRGNLSQWGLSHEN